VQWAERQAALLRDRAAGKLVNDAAPDWSNIAEEIEDVGRSHRREVRNRLSVLCQHLLKGRSSRNSAAEVGALRSSRSGRN
jgi:hypothetical protein